MAVQLGVQRARVRGSLRPLSSPELRTPFVRLKDRLGLVAALEFLRVCTTPSHTSASFKGTALSLREFS